MCAAKSFNSICRDAGTGPGVLPSHPIHPSRNSRNGYAATATLSRGTVGNFTEGSDRPDAPANSGRSHAPAVAKATCPRNCLRLFAFMRVSLPENVRGLSRSLVRGFGLRRTRLRRKWFRWSASVVRQRNRYSRNDAYAFFHCDEVIGLNVVDGILLPAGPDNQH